MRALFVVKEPGAAAYFAPLWRRWRDRGAQGDLFIVAGPIARRHMQRLALDGIACVEALPDNVLELRGMLPKGFAPDVIGASATNSPAEQAARDLAKSLGRKCVQVVDTWVNYAGRFDGRWPDCIAVVDRIAVEEAKAEGLPGDKLSPVGQPAWETTLPLPPAPRDNVLFVGQPIEKRFGPRLGYTERDSWAVTRQAAARRPDLIGSLIYAAHPEEDMKGRDDVPLNARTDFGAEKLHAAGTVVGMSSALMADAVLAGRQTISVQPRRGGANLDPLSRHGRIPLVQTADELIAALQSDHAADDDLRRIVKGSCQRLEAELQRLAA